jgi:hypothetical protein
LNDLLLVVVKSGSKVLPVLEVHGDSPKLGVVAVQDLEAALVGIALSDERSSLELDLVAAEISSLVPDVEVLVGKVQRPLGVLLDAPVESLDTLATLTVGSILEELELCATESKLLLEDGLVGEGDLDSLEAAIEAGGLVGRELEDLRPGQVVTLDEASVEDGVCGGGVKGLGRGVGRDTAIENNGALGGNACGRGCNSSRGRKDHGKECLSEHGDCGE